jgi:hypothetical protein
MRRIQKRWAGLSDVWKASIWLGLALGLLYGIMEMFRYGVVIGVLLMIGGAIGTTVTMRFVFGGAIQTVLNSRRSRGGS